MLSILCKCPECGASANPSSHDTIVAYCEEFRERRVLTPTLGPPTMPDYILFRCVSSSCRSVFKKTHKEALEMMSKAWSELAWSYYLTELNQSIGLEKYFTKYLMLKGLNKFVTQEDIDNSEIIREFVKYVEEESTKQGDDS